MKSVAKSKKDKQLMSSKQPIDYRDFNLKHLPPEERKRLQEIEDSSYKMK